MSIESNQPLPDQAQAKYQELVWRLRFLRTIGPEPDPEPSKDQILDWYKRLPTRPKPLSHTGQGDGVKTLNQHFSQLFPDQVQQYGAAFLEVAERNGAGQIQTTPLCINHDFFAACFSDPGLGLDVVYFEPDMHFYYNSAFEPVFMPVSPEKLQNLYRGLLLRSAGILKNVNGKLNLWAEFRSDKNTRMVVQRAKSILAADQSFFGPTSSHQRVKGQELHERIARKFVDDLLTCAPGQTLLLTDAFSKFCDLLKQNGLEPVKRSEFKQMVVPLIKSQFDLCLRNDLKIDERQGVRGWKNLMMAGQTRPG